MSPANSESNKRVVTVLPGDGIGPECVFSALKIIEATGVDLEWDMQEGRRKCLPTGYSLRRATRDD